MAFKRSRNGLTRCASCGAHIRAEAHPEDTRCGFCGTQLTSESSKRGLVGRGGIVAASLVGVSSAACGGAEEPPPQSPADTPVTAPAPDPDPVTDPSSGWDPTPPDDNNVVAEYGVVPEPIEDVVVPMYGVAPQEADDGQEPLTGGSQKPGTGES